MAKQITKATFKSFIRKNKGNLLISNRSSFWQAMTDGIDGYVDKRFLRVIYDGDNVEPTMGIVGVWLVGQSRDYFTAYEQDGLEGIEASNCCGSFVVAIRTQANE